MVVQVVGAVFHKADKILLFRRLEGLRLFEFPGGKIEAGETHAQALHREIQEELAVEIEIGEKVGDSDFLSRGRNIQLTAYLVQPKSWTFNLSDHDQTLWIEEGKEPWDLIMPADRKLVEAAFGLIAKHQGKR